MLFKNGPKALPGLITAVCCVFFSTLVRCSTVKQLWIPLFPWALLLRGLWVVRKTNTLSVGVRGVMNCNVNLQHASHALTMGCQGVCG